MHSAIYYLVPFSLGIVAPALPSLFYIWVGLATDNFRSPTCFLILFLILAFGFIFSLTINFYLALGELISSIFVLFVFTLLP